MASAKDLMSKIGGTGGGFAKKPLVKPLISNPDDAPAAAGENAQSKHFDPSQKGHNMKKGGSATTGNVLSNVRPKV